VKEGIEDPVALYNIFIMEDQGTKGPIASPINVIGLKLVSESDHFVGSQPRRHKPTMKE